MKSSPEDNALITLPNANKLLLMSFASLNLCPTEPVLLTLSEPLFNLR